MARSHLRRRRSSSGSYKSAKSWLSVSRSKQSKRASEPIVRRDKRKSKRRQPARGKSVSFKKRATTRSKNSRTTSSARSKSQEVRCPICLEKLRNSFGSLPCKHRFHIGCICAYFEDKARPSCPLCRREYTPGFASQLCRPVWEHLIRKFAQKNRSWFNLDDVANEPRKLIEVYVRWFDAQPAGGKRQQYLKRMWKVDPHWQLEKVKEQSKPQGPGRPLFDENGPIR